MSKTILIAGPSPQAFRQYLRDHDYNYVVMKEKFLASELGTALEHQVVGTISSTESILAASAHIQQAFAIDGVMATFEKYIVPAAIIAHDMGLPALPIKAAEACTDKYRMRQKFAAASSAISPNFLIVTNEAAMLAFADQYGYPVILKPTNLTKSLLVTKSLDTSELLKNYRQTMEKIEKVYQKYAPYRIPKLLIEEYLAGSTHSVDAFIDHNGVVHVLEQVVDYQTGYDIGYDDNFHYSRLVPSRLAAEQIQAIREVAALGCQALGMKNSPAHIEIILTKDGPKIVEIGARNGGYRDRIHQLAHGIDITANAIGIALGQQPELSSQRNDPCAVLELFPKQAGSFRGITQEAELRLLPSFVSLRVKTKPGKHIGKSSEGYKMAAVIVLHNRDAGQFRQDLAYVNEQVHVITV